MKHDGTDTNLLSATTLESQNFKNSAASLVYSFQQSGSGQFCWGGTVPSCEASPSPAVRMAENLGTYQAEVRNNSWGSFTTNSKS